MPETVWNLYFSIASLAISVSTNALQYWRRLRTWYNDNVIWHEWLYTTLSPPSFHMTCIQTTHCNSQSITLSRLSTFTWTISLVPCAMPFQPFQSIAASVLGMKEKEVDGKACMVATRLSASTSVLCKAHRAFSCRKKPFYRRMLRRFILIHNNIHNTLSWTHTTI